MKKIFPYIGFVVLALLVLFQFYNPFNLEPEPGRGAHVGDYVPEQLDGWTVTNKELGATESIRDRAARILNLEDFVYRNYTRGDGDEFFEVYVAYWSPGKASILEVSSHTPDRCWTENGWTMLDKEHQVEKEVENKALLPSEWRAFEIQGNEQFVHYWHLVGGKSYQYGQRRNAFPTPYSYVRDLLRSHVLGTGEQYFIRINTNIPFEELWYDRQFQKVVSEVAGLGLEVEAEDLESSS
ncbi:MAG: exosortase-associated EpsI family protein [Verrucomicrobiota bacterium]